MEETQIEPNGVTLARLARPRSSVPKRIAVVSDAHVATRAEGTDKMFHTTEERLESAVESLNCAEPDLVVFNGDLTKDGEPWNFERFDEAVSHLDAPFVATPGNHDVPKSWDDHSSPTAEDFASKYAPEPFPFVRRVGDVDAVVLNSASVPDGSLAGTHGGRVSRSQLDWLEVTLGKLRSPVVFLHHSILPILPRGYDDDRGSVYSLHNGSELLNLLDRHEVPVAVTAHHHIPDARSAGSVTEVTTPASCSYPQAHTLIDIDDDGTTVRMVPHAYRDEQREAYEALTTASNRRSEFAHVASENIKKAPLVDTMPKKEVGESLKPAEY